jgi:TonB-dependent starch-binding outer membrane protein SusC
MIHRTTILVVLLALLLPGVVLAQHGQITGRVIDAETGNPLPGANVLVIGTQIGAATDGDGYFILNRVPAGERSIEARFVGYRSLRQQVTLQVGADITLNFNLRASALELDDVIVTGQARDTRRREIGSVVTSVSTAGLQEAPVTSLSQLLQGRAPGVLVQQGSGAVGTASRIVLRGPTSLTQGVQPVIYVDGVRIDNSTSTGVWTGSNSWTGLDDINWADVERVEIIKGASAATLYGTQAASGVIQIFTKDGRRVARPTSWTFQSQAGYNYTPLSYFENVSVYAKWFHEEIMRTGFFHQQQLSASGQVGGYQYYASLTYNDNEGVYPTNRSEYIGFRGNLQFLPREDLVMRINQAYSERQVFAPQDGNNIFSYMINGLTGGPRGGFLPPDLMNDYDVRLKSMRYQGSLTAEYQPLANLTTRLVVGADIYNSDNTELSPYGLLPQYPFGQRWNRRRNSTLGTLELTGNYVANLSQDISSNLTVGFQGISQDQNFIDAWGEEFPMPGLTTIGSAAITGATETRIESKEYGIFMQERLGFYDLFFMTFGFRGDRHSAFGIDFGWGIYPSVGVSYVMSEHGIFNEFFGNNEFRIRAQYGQAGRPPGTFDHLRTWTAVSARGGAPAVTTSNLGNPDLGPEVSEELEVGFDLAVLQNRINIEFTYYNQRTKDALLNVRYPPSRGFLATQLENVAEIQNIGYELALNATVLDLPNFRWNLGYNFSYNENEIVDMADVPETTVQWTQRNRVGYPVASFFADRYVGVDAEGNPIVEEDAFIGPAFPLRQMQISNNFNLFRNLNFSFMFDYAGGHYIESATMDIMTWFFVGDNDPVLGEEYWDLPVAPWARDVWQKALELIDAGQDAFDLNNYDDPVMAAWVLGNLTGAFSGPLAGNYVLKADYWKLRELTVSYNIPGRFVRGLGIRNASIYFTGRNLWRESNNLTVETEADYNTFNEYTQQEMFIQPLPATYIMGLRFNF